MTALTLQEAKDQATKEITHGEYSSFETIKSYAGITIGYNIISVILDEAAELYCQSQKAQAWEQGFEEGYNYRSARSPESIKVLGEPTKSVNPYLIETKKD